MSIPIKRNRDDLRFAQLRYRGDAVAFPLGCFDADWCCQETLRTAPYQQKHGQEKLTEFLEHLNSANTKIKHIMEKEAVSTTTLFWV